MRVRTTAMTALFVLAVMTAACRATGGRPRSETRPRAQMARVAVPDEQKSRPNPVPSSARSIESGGRVFESVCVSCHGTNGSGKGPLARSLVIRPPDFRRPSEQDARTDGELFYVLTNGHDAMPGQGERWSEELKWDIVNYIRTLRRGRPRISHPEPSSR